jgi:hypothetical protein
MAPQEVQILLNNDVLMEVLKGLTSGLSYTQLTEHLEKQGVKVPPGELPAYVLEANRYFANMAKFTREVEIGKSIERLNALYLSSVEGLDFKTCLQVQKEINQLLGLKTASSGVPLEGEFTIVLPAKKKATKAGKQRKGKQ